MIINQWCIEEKKEFPINSAASCLPLTSPPVLQFSSQTVCGGAAVRLRLSWEQRASPIWRLLFSVGLPPLAGRSGGAFVTGEPLIKFTLHPWPAAGARRDGGGGVGGGDGGGGLSDSWHWTGLLFFLCVIEALLMSLRFWPPSPGAWHRRAQSRDDVTSPLTCNRGKAGRACNFSTWHVLHLCSLKYV